MRTAWIVIGLAACNGGKSRNNPAASDKPAVGASPGAPTAPPKMGVTGEIHLSGALEGTFTWKKDLAVDTCGWVADTHVGALGVTMSDGKDSFISLTAGIDNSGTKKITLTGGKLKLPHAGSMSGNSGAELSGTQDGDDSTVSVIYKHATVTADGQTVTIDGTISGNCKYSP